MKNIFSSLILSVILLLLPLSVSAQAPNNKYGIHLAQPHIDDFKVSADLVNSNGGKWGYVTLVIQENDRDKDKWQGVFDRMRELRLIPIIRIATKPEGENWRRPTPEDAGEWAAFLDSLNWVVKERYVTLFNEPNHGQEWGGEVHEKSFAEVSLAFAKALKDKDPDFFVMLAGLDASAPSWPTGMEDEEVFLERVFSEKPEIAEYLDGLSSHSYPNPGFAGSPLGSGRGSVRTYEWELGLFRRLGVGKELPVFITETGWKRGSESGVADNFRIAFSQVWGPDGRVRAVTPFVLDYQGPPFLDFSWKKFQSSDYYEQFSAVQSLPKLQGIPDQVQKGELRFHLPAELVAQSHYTFKVNLVNDGQAIWDVDDGYELKITGHGGDGNDILVSDLKDIRPGEEKTAEFIMKTERERDFVTANIQLVRGDETVIGPKTWKFRVLPLPSLDVEVGYWPFGNGNGDDFEIQLFDYDERLIYKKKGVTIKDGRGTLTNVQNIAIDELYRAVILKPGYLPRQRYIIFKTTDNTVKFRKMLPFDKNSDGKLDLSDILIFFGR